MDQEESNGIVRRAMLKRTGDKGPAVAVSRWTPEQQAEELRKQRTKAA